jgi:hypothetical protein
VSRWRQGLEHEAILFIATGTEYNLYHGHSLKLLWEPLGSPSALTTSWKD